MIKSIQTIFKKELKDAVRDRRSYMASFAFSLFPPLIIVLLFFMLQDKIASDKDVEVKFIGAEHAPALVEIFNSAGIIEGWDDKSKIEINISEDFVENINEGKPAELILTANYSDKSSRSKISRIKTTIRGYSNELASLRLMMRGINPTVVSPVALKEKDTSTPSAKTALILGGLIVMIIQAIFISGMNVAIDSSAGERERNSLELLLSHPISTFDIVMGKALNASVFSLVGLILSTVFSFIAMVFVPLHKIGLTIDVSVWQALFIIIVCAPLTLLVSSLQMLVSFKAKNFKEAQVYVSYIIFLPLMVVMGHNFMEWDFPGLQLIPILGQTEALTAVFKGESADILPLILNQVVCLALAFGVIQVIAKSLRSEKTVFGL
jgi:sodium transport system permease protein